MSNLSVRSNPLIIENLEKRRKQKIVYFFLLLGLLFFAVLAILAYLQKNYTLVTLDLLAFLLTASMVVVCDTRRNLRFVSYFITSILAGMLLFLIYLGGAGGALAMWMFIFPISSVFLLGMKVGAYCSAATVLVAIFSMYFLPEYGGYHYLPGFRYRFFAVFLIIFLFTAAYEIGQEKMYFFLKKYMKRLRSTLTLLEERQKQYKTIMNCVDHGLFLLDDKLTIQRNYSKQLLKIFDLQEDVAGMRFGSLLKNRVFQAVIVQAENHLKSLLQAHRDSSTEKDKKHKESAIKNPLTRLLLQDPLGLTSSKLLSFSFRVIRFKTGAKQIFVKVTDISVSNRIKTKLEKADDQKKYESELLFEIMNSSEQSVSIFLHYIANKIPELCRVWEEGMFAAENQQKKQSSDKDFFSIWLSQLHAIKGNASISGFHLTSELLHRTEGEISKLNMQGNSKKETVASLRKAGAYMQKMLEHLELLRAVADRLTAFQQSYQKAEMDELKQKLLAASQPLDGNKTIVALGKGKQGNSDRLFRQTNINKNNELENRKMETLNAAVFAKGAGKVSLKAGKSGGQTTTNLDRLISTMRSALQTTASKHGAATTALRLGNSAVSSEYFEKVKRENRLENSNGLAVLLDVSGMHADDFSNLEHSLIQDLQDVLIQLVKNSVVHGMETKKQREQAGKSQAMTICIDSRRIARRADANPTLVLHFYDDGRGWHSSLLQEASKETTKQTIGDARVNARVDARVNAVSPDKDSNAQNFKNKQQNLAKQQQYIAQKIFEPGFSTKKFADIDAGHGLGMGMMHQRLAPYRGKIRLMPLKVGVGFEITFSTKKNEED